MGKVNWGLVGIVILILIVAGFLFIFKEKKGDTSLYFSIESNLPDPSIYLKLSENISRNYVYPIYINKTYSIVFSITSNEKKKTSYIYNIISPILSKTEEITLNPKETRKISLTLSPTESQKWSIGGSNESITNGSVDITKYSWIAQKKDLEILVREDGLPLLVEENYNLPLSSSIGEYGEILHTNLSLEDLRKKPFVKEYIEETVSATYMSIHSSQIVLEIKDNRLSSYVNRTATIRASNPQTFLIYLKKLGKAETDPETGREFHRQIYFNYQII